MSTLSLQPHVNAPAPDYVERLRWFHEARFGMFIHWGLYSILGRGEWIMYSGRMPAEEYAALADRFTPERFDADAWAGLAAEAGMRYAVLTTRHHDGFCLYNSAASDFTSAKRAAKRDFVAEYVEALRRAGLRVGLYYSLADWRFDGYWNYQTNPDDAARMKDQAYAQVRELMTNYGRIDELFYDGHMLNMEDGGNPAAGSQGFWEPHKLNAMVRQLQPSIIINNRAGSDEDLDTPEQHVTASRPGRGWEANMTIGDSQGWGYVKHNPNWKTVPFLLQCLCKAAAGEGNFLLNVAPASDGSIREEETSRLRAMGAWLAKHGEAIYGSQRCPLSGGNIGAWTAKGNVGYLLVYRWPGSEFAIPLVKTRVRSATLLTTGQPAPFRYASNGRVVFHGLPETPPDPNITVLRIEFEGEPEALAEPDTGAFLRGGVDAATGAARPRGGGPIQFN